MPTEEQTKPTIATCHSGRADTEQLSTEWAVDRSTPTTCDSVVAAAMSHLFSGFVLINKLLRATPVKHRKLLGPLDHASENISLVLVDLNVCSRDFWDSRDTRNRSDPLRRCYSAFTHRGRVRVAARPPLQSNKGSQFVQPNVSRMEPTTLSNLSRIPEIFCTQQTSGDPAFLLASAVLQLVGAYRAFEALSASPFPDGAPYSFEHACHCLCTALLILDECSTGMEAPFR